MDDTTRDLIQNLTANVMEQVNQEIELGRILRNATEVERNEIAYLIEDEFNMHPNRPTHATVTMSKVEQYVAYHLRRAVWKSNFDDLMDEADDLDQMPHNLFADDVTLGDPDELDEYLDEATEPDIDAKLNAIEAKMDELSAEFDRLMAKDEDE